MTNALKSRTLKQRLLSGSAWALTGKAASVLAALLVNALLARLLSPQDFGAYFLAFSMVYLGATVGALGLNQLVVRFVAESMGLGQFGRVRRVVSLTLTLGVLGALGVGIVPVRWTRCGGRLVRRSFTRLGNRASGRMDSGDGTANALYRSLQGLQRHPSGFDLRRIIVRYSTGLLPDPAVATRGAGNAPSSCATRPGLKCCQYAAGGLAVAAEGRGPPVGRRRGQNSTWADLARAAWPFLVTSLSFSALTQADIWILGAFRPQEDVAIYGAAARMVI